MAASPRTRLDRLIAIAERELKNAAGDVSLCAVSRAGRPMPAIKYQEGRTAALRDLRRRLDAGADWSTAPADIRAGLARQASLADKSAEWFAYVEGGRDALAELGV